MRSATLLTAFNAHTVKEFYAAHLYRAMSAWCDAEGLAGCCSWFLQQAAEEHQHAMKFFRFILDLGGRIELGAIEAPPSSWPSIRAVFDQTLAHERVVTEAIGTLVDLARTERDHAAETFLAWFVTEQVEEEATVQTILDRLTLAGNDGPALLLIDRELGARQSAQPE